MNVTVRLDERSMITSNYCSNVFREKLLAKKKRVVFNDVDLT